MNLGQVARLLAGFTLLFSTSLLVPLAVSLYEASTYATIAAFASALAVGLTLSLLLWFLGRRSDSLVFRREGLAAVGLAWLTMSAIAAMPLQWSGVMPDASDALFEAVSGLTTTGATVLDPTSAEVETLPASILLWRSMLQWMGGLGVILVFVVLLPGMGFSGNRVPAAEQTGINSSADRPRLRDQARRLISIYLVMSALCGVGYWLTGLSPVDAVNYALTTVSTGGFGTHDTLFGGHFAAELVAIVFMFLAGCNFLLLVQAITGNSRTLLRSTEFKVYAWLTLLVAASMTATLWIWGQPLGDNALGLTRDYGDFSRCVRDATFQAVSILTGTGYSSTDYNFWPKPALYLLMMCMFVGGCTGSTTGGFKILRVVVCAKLIGYALHHFIRPRSVQKLKVGAEPLSDGVVSAILSLLVLWIATVAIGTFLLDLDPRLDMVSAFSASLSMVGCVGPAISGAMPGSDGSFALIGQIDLGPYGGYGELHPATKLFMSLQMILGRLEIVAPLALLTPGFWRR